MKEEHKFDIFLEDYEAGECRMFQSGECRMFQSSVLQELCFSCVCFSKTINKRCSIILYEAKAKEPFSINRNFHGPKKIWQLT
jgi:hypothetical protein